MYRLYIADRSIMHGWMFGLCIDAEAKEMAELA